MIEVELPDGTVAEFPEGMTPDQIQGVLQKQFGGGSSAPTAAPSPAPAQTPQRVAIATTPDGGTVWRMPDGSQSFSSPNYSTNDPARVAQILEGATPAQAWRSSGDEAIIADRPVLSRVVKTLEGVPFAGSYGDELAGALYGDQARDAWRATSDAMGRERPKESLAWGLGGGLASSVPVAFAAPAMGTYSLMRNILTGAAVGGAEGAVSGFGRGDGAGDRFANAGIGAGLGMGLGAALPVVAHGLGAAWRGARNAMQTRRGLGPVADDLGISRRGGRLVSDILELENPRDVRAALARGGDSAMLADGGRQLAGSLDASIQAPGPAARIALDRIDDRARAVGGETDTLMNKLLGVPEGVETAKAGIRDSTREARKAAYDAAYSREIDWRSPAGERLRGLIESTPDDVLRAAGETRAMMPRPTQQIPDSAYPEFAERVTTAAGPDSWLSREMQEVDDFFTAYGQSGGSMDRRPVTNIIKQMGGVDPNSPAGQELKAMGMTARNSPGVFRNSGLKDLDNLDPSRFPDVMQGGVDDTGNYMGRQSVIDALIDERNGRAVRSNADQFEIAAQEELERLLPDYMARQGEIDRIVGQPAPPPNVGDIVPTKTVEDIDAIKRQLDHIVRSNEGQGLMGALGPRGMAADRRAKEIRNSLIEAVPEYGKALEVATDAISRVNAVETGRTMLTAPVTRERFKQSIEGMAGAERDAVKQGVRSYIDDVTARIRAVPSDQNADIREVANLWGSLSSRDARDKIRMLLPEDEAKTLFRQLDKAGSALGLRARVATNSLTMGRTTANEMIDEAVAPNRFVTGEGIGPLVSTRAAWAAATGSTPAAVKRAGRAARGELADILTRPQARQILDAFENARMKYPALPNAGQGVVDVLMRGGLSLIPSATRERQKSLQRR